MKRIDWKLILTALFACILISIYVKIQTSASNLYTEPQIVRCTCYCDYGYTKSGQYVRNGIIAGKEEWLGKVAALYEIADDGSIGDFIGYYEFLDTGGEYIQSGERVDVWVESESAVNEWINRYGDYVYIQIIEGVG